MRENGNWEPLTSEEDEDRIEETIKIDGGYCKVARWRKNNIIASEEYFDKQGQRHREDGPASVNYYGHSGTLAHTDYFWHGLLHRVDGPAEQNWWSSGMLDEEAWYVDGVRHREGKKPALTRMDMSGDFVECEEYYVKGRLHRSNGPAVVARSRYVDQSKGCDEIIEKVKYYHHGLLQSGPVGGFNLTPS